MTEPVVVPRTGEGLEAAQASGQPIGFVCGDIFSDGCERVVEGPTWLHEGEFVDHDGRYPGPHLASPIAETVLDLLATSVATPLRWLVALSPGTPAPIVARLAHDPDPWVRGAAVRSPYCPADLLVAAATSPIFHDRHGAAENRATPPDLLAALSEDPEPAIRMAVTTNVSLPADHLAALLDDTEPAVRMWATHASGDGDVLQRAAADPEPAVRAAAALNPATPLVALERLATDPDERVREQALVRFHE